MPVETTSREVEARLERVRRGLAAANLDAALVSSVANFTYCSGYTTPSWANPARPMAVLVEADRASAVVSNAEGERILELGHVDVIPYTDPKPQRGPTGELVLDFGAALADRIGDHLSGRGIERLGVELSGVPGGLAYTAIARIGELSGAELVDASALFATLRQVKSEYEIACLREAAQAAGRVFADLLPRLRVGMTEREIRTELSVCAAHSGCDELRLATIVAGSGPMAGSATDRSWRDGELLIIDLGLTYRGYWSDLSRHFVAGEPTPAQLDGYARVIEAFDAGHPAARSGTRAADLAAVLASTLPSVEGRSTGRLGHGIGLDITEAPSLTGIDDTALAAGATICLEPHAWFEDAGWIVGEEMVVVTDAGAELLSPPFPAELPVVTAS